MADRVAIMKLGRVVQVGTPSDLYHQPASRFVAEFLGETNFVPARVMDGAGAGAEAGGGIMVRTDAGELRSTRAAPAAPRRACTGRGG